MEFLNHDGGAMEMTARQNGVPEEVLERTFPVLP